MREQLLVSLTFFSSLNINDNGADAVEELSTFSHLTNYMYVGRAFAKCNRERAKMRGRPRIVVIDFCTVRLFRFSCNGHIECLVFALFR